jgi:aspartyl-tRNA(Asn)/glutamyl-tRNA(Gln) amidotransferase subunit A
MTRSNDPTALDVVDLAAQLADRKLSSVELTEACLARIARHNDALHAFIDVYAEDARNAAKAADLARGAGHAVGPLHGIPFGLKDLVDFKGRVTTGGSKAWKDRVSETTGTMAQRLIATGMIVIGKTHTVEFAFGAWGTNQHMGAPRNPWDMRTHRTPGGSSSGSGVAVSSRMVPWAIGTDTGGSVRIPSAMCGLTGLKTTVGLIPTDGILPLSPTLDTVGPLARSAADAALLFDVMRTDGRQLTTKALRRGAKGLRLARMPDNERDGVDAAVLAPYDESLRTLAGMGAEIVDIALPHRFVEFAAMTGDLIAMDGYPYVGHLVEDPTSPIDEEVRRRFMPAASKSSTDYLMLLQKREQMRRAMDAALAGVDALLTPTSPTTAIPVADVLTTKIVASHFTRVVNMLGGCALAMPNGFASGLPTSLHIVCGPCEEETALRIGMAYQSATDWHRRAPNLDS